MRLPRFLVDFSIALLVGLAAWFLKADGAIGFLLGISALFAIETARLIPLVEKIYQQYQAVNALLESLRATDKFSEILLLYGLKDLHNLSNSCVSVGKDDVRPFWKDCVARAKSKWTVFTYARVDETWGLSWAQEALAIQRERLISGCTIERVFIVDDVAEKAQLQAIMEEHSKTGVTVFWLLKSDILSNTTAKEYLTRVGTLDFGVADDTWVYRTVFDAQRNITGANAIKDQDVRDKAVWLIKEAQGAARGKNNLIQVAIGT